MSDDWKVSVLQDGENEAELKRRFAQELIKTPNKPIDAAIVLFADIGRAVAISGAWSRDPEVIALVRELSGGAAAISMLPTKEEFSLEVLGVAREEKSTATKLTAYKLYAEIQGLIERNGTNVNIQQNNIVNNRVLKVPVFASDLEAETYAAIQQDRLVADASRH